MKIGSLSAILNVSCSTKIPMNQFFNESRLSNCQELNKFEKANRAGII